MYPWHFHARELTANPLWILGHAWPPYLGANQIKDIVVNVLFYWPLGLFGFLAFSQTRPRAVAGAAPIAIGFALSCGMEILQLFDAGRDTSAMDVLSNTAGSAAGVVSGILLGNYLRQIGRSLRTIPYHQPGALLLLICLAIRELLPFFPDYSPYRVWHKLLALPAVNGSSALVFAASLITWLAVARLVEAATEPPWVSRIYVALLALVPAKILVLGRTAGVVEIAGAGAACFIWHYGVRRYGRRSGLLAILFFSLILIRGLSPFHFTGEANPVSWIPFRALLGMGRVAAVGVFFEKLFTDGTLVWLLHDSGWQMRYAAAVAAAAVAALEAAQVYLPARVPDVTDPLLVLLVAGILALAERTIRKTVAGTENVT